MATALQNYGHKQKKSSLFLAALGIVFGDIGTSPLYTLKECFGHSYGLEPTEGNILGILSLVFWAIVFVVSLKYVSFIMRVDNNGEGGIMALTSLVVQKARLRPGYKHALIVLGLIGASLFYGDGIITPAISVLSAVEGLEVLNPALHDFIVPIAIIVLITLFISQRHGTSKVGALFGPIMLIWFLCLAILGGQSVLQTPSILFAINPVHGIDFFITHGWHGLLVLAGVVLAITGGEALYADMGHFGRAPIANAWFFLALPALVINYLGQAALLIRKPSAIDNPFYLLVPPDKFSFVIILATLATVIASQAVISGAFSLTAQAIQLGFSPRLRVLHTSEGEMGQIYLPGINWALMLGVIGLILGFQSSSALAGAYGIAVTGTMLTTTIMAMVVLYRLWKWPIWFCGMASLSFLGVDLAFLGANAMKIVEGGWFPLLIGLLVFLVLSTWRLCRIHLLDRLQEVSMPLAAFLQYLESHPPIRVKGTAVFLSGNRKGIPISLLLNLKHNKALHENLIILTVITEPVPRVKAEKRRVVTKLSDSIFRVNLHYGFSEAPNIPKAILTCSREINIDTQDTYYFIGRELIDHGSMSSLAQWQIKLFMILSRNTDSAAYYYKIPLSRVIEIGSHVTI